jgi:hypothetical protein
MRRWSSARHPDWHDDADLQRVPAAAASTAFLDAPAADAPGAAP